MNKTEKQDQDPQLQKTPVSSSQDDSDFDISYSQEEKDFEFSIMAEYYEEERIEEEKRLKTTNRILNALKKIMPIEWITDLKDYAKEAGVHNPFKIVKKPKGKYQTENEFKNLKGVWAEQQGGYPIEDSFYGTVTVKIDDRRYLQMPFCS